ncbi:MAG: hypothetical protein ACK55I_01865, partial [bacterium]
IVCWKLQSGRPFTTSKMLQTVGREKAVVGPKHGCKKHGQPAPGIKRLWPAIYYKESARY